MRFADMHELFHDVLREWEDRIKSDNDFECLTRFGVDGTKVEIVELEENIYRITESELDWVIIYDFKEYDITGTFEKIFQMKMIFDPELDVPKKVSIDGWNVALNIIKDFKY